MKKTLMFLMICCFSAALFAQEKTDWPHWMGPNYDMTSNEKGLLREWTKEGPNVLWRTKIETGWACPSISGNDLFMAETHFDPNSFWYAKAENLVCYDATTGKEKWRYTWPASYCYASVQWGVGGVRATPAVTDKYVYGIDPVANMKCVDRKTGKLVWENSLGSLFSGPGMDIKGWNSSALVVDNVLVVPMGTGKEGKGNHYAMTVGFNASTGKEIWRNEEEKKTKGISYPDAMAGESAVLFTLNKNRCALVSYNGYLRAYRISDGKEIMKFHMFPAALMTQATPVLAGNRVVIQPFCANMACAEIDTADPANTKLAWSTGDHYVYGDVHNELPYEGYLYGINGYFDAPPEKVLECYDLKNGKKMWESPRLFKMGYAYTEADGLLFLRSFQTLWLVELNPSKFILKNKVEKIHDAKGTEITDPRGLADFTMPVISRGKLYVRTPTELICYDIAKH